MTESRHSDLETPRRVVWVSHSRKHWLAIWDIGTRKTGKGQPETNEIISEAYISFEGIRLQSEKWSVAEKKGRVFEGYGRKDRTG